MSSRASWLFSPLLILLLAFGALLTQAQSSPALTVNEIVQMYASGLPARELRDRIGRAEQVAFDLSDEMIHELREAGLPEELIVAMIERQAHDERKRRALASETEADAPPQGSAGSLTIRLNPRVTNPKKRRLRAYDQHDPRHDRRFQTGNNRYVDLGLFVACTTPDHVPDHWRLHTPLVNTFMPVPRHRLLTFVGGATWRRSSLFERFGRASNDGGDNQTVTVPVADRDRLGLLELRIPSVLEVTLTRGIPHDLVFGLAVATDDGFTAWALIERPDLVLDDVAMELEAEVQIRSKSLSTAAVSLEGAVPPDPQ